MDGRTDRHTNPIAFERPGIAARRGLLRTALGNIAAGLKLALNVHVHRNKTVASVGLLVIIIACDVLLAVGIDRLAAGPGVQFSPDGLLSQGLAICVGLIAALICAGTHRAPPTTLEFAVGFFNGVFWIHLLSAPFWVASINDNLWREWPMLYEFIWVALLIWPALVALRLQLVFRPRSGLRAIVQSFAWLMISATVALGVNYSPFWVEDGSWRTAGSSINFEEPERILGAQPAMVQQSVADVTSQPGRAELFSITFAGYGEQDLFRNEALFAADLFAGRYGAGSRSVALVNHAGTVDRLPLATPANLESTLQALGTHADEDDVLMLYLTSHGTEDHELVVSLGNLDLEQLKPEALAKMLDASAFRWKVVVVSACFSGGYIPWVEAPDTVVITAARADRTSFGCSDEADFSYFGDAFLVDALQSHQSLRRAFMRAQRLIARREGAIRIEASRPQIRMGAAISRHLDEAGLPLTATVEDVR